MANGDDTQTVYLPRERMRARAEVPSADLNTAMTVEDGWIIPIYTEELSNGEQRYGLGLADFQRVVAGYACPRCLLKFKVYLAICPMCRYERDLAKDVLPMPRYWETYEGRTSDEILRGNSF